MYIFVIIINKCVLSHWASTYLFVISDNLSWKLAQVFRPYPENWTVAR